MRHAAFDTSFSATKLSETIRPVLETYLRDYLRDRLKTHCSITVKWVRETKIASVFRDSKQGPSRPVGELEERDEHYFYQAFYNKVHEQNEMRCLVVHDTNLQDVPDALRVRASRRRYRSCLALPLNLVFIRKDAPAPSQARTVVLNLGFLSIDTVDPDAFRDFFVPLDPNHPMGNRGENHRPKAELHLLYGVADAVATIIAIADGITGGRQAAA